MNNYLTIDVEDYFQVSAFEKNIGHSRWSEYDCRVKDNTKKLLDVLEASGVNATFFVLGWVAQKFPELVKEIHAKGNEIACHSYYHRLVYNLTPEEFREDTRLAKDVLEQIIGETVNGYRAPSYSITKKSLWAFDILEELGFQYDSSVFPIIHDRYGIADSPRFQYKLSGYNLIEYPISTTPFIGYNLPVAGGGYFRLFPYWFSKRALHAVNRREKKPFMFYIHPWEIDSGQPRVTGAGLVSNFRHYVNIDKTLMRFQRLINDFEFDTISASLNKAEYDEYKIN
ncbi:MAG: DUF3473 domain-containing protein [Nitrospira sp.]|nr:DUF3473 domain-containing protein [Candidatus Brocadiales bacterium]MBL7048837.1 DUF3473 domain-containing protein [Nitrospira sp.]